MEIIYSSGLGLERFLLLFYSVGRLLRLNPLFIRSRFGTIAVIIAVTFLVALVVSLNPLFIRSRFGTGMLPLLLYGAGVVSIPYSSGLGLER